MLLIFASCSNEPKELTAGQIVERIIEKAGGEKYEQVEIEFRFRKYRYQSSRKGGEFELQRIITDSTGAEIRDVLSNAGFERFRNDSAVEIADSMRTKYSNSVNSVHYFVQLPYGLNAPAANKKLIGKDSLQGEEYYKIKVTFDAEGGGTDHEDEYLYWIDTQDFTVDYLAYNYEVNGGGIRFRKAYNPRNINGLRFVDYKNFRYNKPDTPLKDLDSLYEQGKLDLLTTIKNRDIKVNLLR